MERIRFRVGNMLSAACCVSVERAISRLNGTHEVCVSLPGASVSLQYDPDVISSDEISRAAAQAGYPAVVDTADTTQSENVPLCAPVDKSEPVLRRFWISLFPTLAVVWLSVGQMTELWVPFLQSDYRLYALLQFVLTLPAISANRMLLSAGIQKLLSARPDMDTLVAMGAGSAWIYGIYGLIRSIFGYRDPLFFDSAVMILTLIALGRYLEARARRRTTNAVSRLLSLTPRNAAIVMGSSEAIFPVSLLRKGDICIVRSGQTVPIDGKVTEGEAEIDRSMLTGEALPVLRKEGDTVEGGTVCTEGRLKIAVTATGKDTALSRIVKLVQDAASSKAPISRMADRVSRAFVPFVITVAAVSFVTHLLCGTPLNGALNAAVCVLIISCPCAIGLAAPGAVKSGMGRGAAMGILVKSASALEIAAKVDTVVFDKKTLTCGKPRLTDCVPFLAHEADLLLTCAASAESHSCHPLAKAVVAAARERGVCELPVSDFHNQPGMGITATVGGMRCLCGNEGMMALSGFDTDPLRDAANRLIGEGKTLIWCAVNTRLLGFLALTDTLKPDAAEGVRRLHEKKIRTVLLTGDSEAAARIVGGAVGIAEIHAQVLPKNRENIVLTEMKRGHICAMVGDAINDAPALTAANVGIAIGAGTDVALDAADIVLMRNSPCDVAAVLSLSRAVVRNIRQNLFWAFIYNILCIPAAAAGRLNPIAGALTMILGSLFVVLNSLRLYRYRGGENDGRTI